MSTNPDIIADIDFSEVKVAHVIDVVWVKAIQASLNRERFAFGGEKNTEISNVLSGNGGANLIILYLEHHETLPTRIPKIALAPPQEEI
ncbi:hypothetical protein F2Q70_00008944 [Brassica cretica]|uniref:Uncharacterized protein n=1 Tax=Brassica cretica TaxID=69181 RepID=A0A8S9M9P6_BRACR|nr:hypothetical protein F2Q70_00008944 [Brassica cretica]